MAPEWLQPPEQDRGETVKEGSDRQRHECCLASKMQCCQRMKGRSAKLAREEQAMRRNPGIKRKASPQESSMRWFGLDCVTGGVRRTGQTSLCFQEDAAEDGLRNKRLVEERLNRPVQQRGARIEKNADSALRGAGRGCIHAELPTEPPLRQWRKDTAWLSDCRQPTSHQERPDTSRERAFCRLFRARPMAWMACTAISSIERPSTLSTLRLCCM